jgi:hypothetical protein
VQLTTAVAGRDRTAPAEARHRHRHDSACFWDVDDCRWQCAPYPRLTGARDRCTAIGPPVADGSPETKP